MRLATLENNIGEKLAAPIYMLNGLMVANKGVVLSEKSIKRIKEMGIESAYIMDENEDVQVEEVLPAQIKLKILKLLDNLFNEAAKKGKLDQKLTIGIVDEIIENINISENAFLLNNIGRQDKDIDLCKHSLNVAILSILVGKNRGYDDKKVLNLGIGALLHDIGKLFTQGKDHVTKGYDFVKNISWLSPTSTICVYEHHENQDGSGYPIGIKGDKIYELAKIVSICNEYVHLNIDKNIMPNETMDIITAKATNCFDPDIYRNFVQSIYCYSNGISVKLNNGLEGVVIMQNKNFPTRPVVCAYKNGTPFHTYNLIENPTLFIEKICI